MQWLFWVIYQKLKRGLELAFGAHFLHGFFHTNAPYLILYQLKKFQCHIFFYFSRYQIKCVSKSYLDN